MSTPSQPPSHGGSTPIGDDRRRRRGGAWWLWLLLALVVVVILLLVLSRCGGSDRGSSGGSTSATTTSSMPSTTTTTATTASPQPSRSPSAAASAEPSGSAPAATSSPTAPATGSGGGASSLVAAGTPVLPLSAAAPSGDLSALVGKAVTATAVTVQSVPADEGFWVGTSTTDRVWVQLRGTGESPYQVKKGDQVDFMGRLVENRPGFADLVGVSPAEGADLLTQQNAHIQVRAGTVTLSTG